jgi:lambda family phage portal protein
MSDKMTKLARLGASAVPSVRAAVYEGATSTRRTLNWRAPTTYPNAVLPDLRMLRDRSRGATRNDGFAKGVIDDLVSNIIGTGMKPLCQVKDETFRSAVEALWTLWTDDADADGQTDFYGLQSLVTRAWLEAGEVFVRLRPRFLTDGLSVPLQLQLLEPEQCPEGYTTVAPNGNKIKAGIEFSPIGKRVAYYFYMTIPGDPNDIDTSKLVRVPADSVLHIYKQLRPGQLRGLPHLTQALVRLRELDKFSDALLLRQQLSAMFVAFLKNMTNANGDALTGETNVDDQDRPVIALEPGAFQSLAPGEEVQFSDPPDVPSSYQDYMKGHLYAVAAATGVPYSVLTGDMSGLNDRVMRVILHEFRRRIQADQHQTIAFQLNRPVYAAWLAAAAESGSRALPGGYNSSPRAADVVTWMPQGWPYIHPVQDVQAAKEAIRNGLTSRAATVAAQGEDAAVIDAQQALDNERADKLGLKYDSDGRSGGASTSPFGKPGAPTPGEDPDADPDAPEPTDPNEPPAGGEEQE